MDKWDRKTNFNCNSCRYYVPKPPYGDNRGACRRRCPTLQGYPVVYAYLGWCGEHKIGSNPVRDGKEEENPCIGLNVQVSDDGNIINTKAPEEKQKIKEEISTIARAIINTCNNTTGDYPGERLLCKNGAIEIKELLEKL